MSIALAATEAGLSVVGILGRGDVTARAARVMADVVAWDEPLPDADLVVLAVRDDAIREVCERVAPQTTAPVVHLSGMATLDTLAAARGPRGSFHPLQTLPTPDAGAAQLRGAGVAIAATTDELASTLRRLAASLEMVPFEVPEERRALYHAAAAASANFVVTALVVAHRLYEAAGIDPAVAARLTETVVANSYALGPAESLTGPIARGDVGTVRAHLAAIAESAPDVLESFRALAAETARVAGTSALFQDVLA